MRNPDKHSSRTLSKIRETGRQSAPAMIVQRKRSPSEDFLDAIEAQIEGAKDDADVSPSWEGEPLYDAQTPDAVPDSLEGAEKQVLILASTGDMALACVVADRLNVDIQKVRQEMTGAPGACVLQRQR